MSSRDSRRPGRLLALTTAVCLAVPGVLALGQAPGAGVRLIAAGTEAEAVQLRDRIASGESFDRLAREHSRDPSGANGGDLGDVVVSDLHPEFQHALDGLAPGEVSAPVRIGNEYFLLGFPTDEERRWREDQTAGILAYREGRYPEAERSLDAALSRAEAFGPGDYRHLESLTALADLQHVLGNHAEAQPLYLRALPLLEADPGPQDIRLARVLNGLGEAYRLQGDAVAAEPYYRRALGLFEQTLGPGHMDVASVLGNLALARQELGFAADAESLAWQSLAIVEASLGPDHTAVATGLQNLAVMLEAQGKHAEAADAVHRSLAIFERTPGGDHTRVADSLNRLAALMEAQGRNTEAQALYRRALAALWGASGDEEEALAAEGISRLTDVLLAASFRDEALRTALERFHRALTAAAPPAGATLAIVELMLESGLPGEAEDLLSEAIGWYPRSGALRIGIAERHAEAGRVARSLGAFDEARRMAAAGTDPAVGREEAAYLDQRIGDLLTEEGRFDEALRAYESALGADPDRPGALLGLGLLYFRGNQIDMALAAYDRLLALDPGNAEAHYRVAQANLGRGRLAEAVQAADEALRIEPGHLQSHFVRARALIRLERTEDGRSALDLYRRLEAERLAGESRRMEALTQLDLAASLLGEGRYEEAAALYREAIAVHPDVADFYLDLGTVESRLGRHTEALGTFLEMLDVGMDDFRVHKSLVREYAFLDDPEAGEHHETRYLGSLFAALRERLR